MIGRNETNWTSSESTKPVRGSTASSSKVTVKRTTSRPRRTSTIPSILKETTPNEAQGLIIDMVKGLVASAQDGGDKNKNKKKRKKPSRNKISKKTTPTTTVKATTTTK